jgi:uncharacterized membrane protein YhdT
LGYEQRVGGRGVILSENVIFIGGLRIWGYVSGNEKFIVSLKRWFEFNLVLTNFFQIQNNLNL